MQTTVSCYAVREVTPDSTYSANETHPIKQSRGKPRNQIPSRFPHGHTTPHETHTQHNKLCSPPAMPAGEASDGEALDGLAFERHEGLDDTAGAEKDQGALHEESAANAHPETPQQATTASGAVAREAAAAPASPVADPVAGHDSPSGSAAATNAGELSAGDFLAGGGDTDPPREPAPGVASARAMVRDDDEVDGEGQPKRITLQNYASRDSGAVMLESSPMSKGMPNLLLDSKDKYAITPCEQQQWAVLGLSEDILVKTIIVGSHEKYSSLLKDFQVRSVSHAVAFAKYFC